MYMFMQIKQQVTCYFDIRRILLGRHQLKMKQNKTRLLVAFTWVATC